MAKKTSLERKMLSYFGLIAAASLLITIEFIYAIQGALPLAQSVVQTHLKEAAQATDLVNMLESLRGKAMLMFVVQGVVTLIVLIMFMRRITGPLQHMVESSSKIMEGDLSRTINIRSMDEIGLMGETINGLTSNIQELVVFSRSTLASVKDELESIKGAENCVPETVGKIDKIEEQLQGLDQIMEDFKLLQPPEPDHGTSDR